MWDVIIYISFAGTIVFVLKDKLFKSAKFVEFYLKFLYCFAVTMTTCGVLLPYFLLSGRNRKNGSIFTNATRHLTKFMNIKWHLRNFENVYKDRGAVILINHQSSLDLLCLNYIWQDLGKIACVSKKELLYFFPFGLIMYLMETIFIDRQNPKDAHKILQIKANNCFRNKIKVVIYPEGKRNSDYTKLLPFKKGAFIIAVGGQVPIIPIVTSRYYFINYKKHIANGGHVIVQCLEPVSTEGLTMDDVPELINRVRSNMERVFKELSEEVLSTLPPDYPLETLD